MNESELQGAEAGGAACEEPAFPAGGEANAAPEPAAPAPDPALTEALREAESLREALAAARAEADALRTRERAGRCLREALAAGGAVPEAVELLAAAVPADRLRVGEDGGLAEGGSLVAELQARYGFLFRPETLVPTPPVAPPRFAGTLTPAALRGMSEAEINRCWGEVRDALRERR